MGRKSEAMERRKKRKEYADMLATLTPEERATLMQQNEKDRQDRECERTEYLKQRWDKHAEFVSLTDTTPRTR